MDEVLDFIQRRFSQDSHWCDGNCYWFAKILSERFPQFSLYILVVENHFVVGDGEVFYDWQGKHLLEELPEKPMLWKDAEEYDSIYYNRVIRDCIL